MRQSNGRSRPGRYGDRGLSTFFAEKGAGRDLRSGSDLDGIFVNGTRSGWFAPIKRVTDRGIDGGAAQVGHWPIAGFKNDFGKKTTSPGATTKSSNFGPSYMAMIRSQCLSAWGLITSLVVSCRSYWCNARRRLQWQKRTSSRFGPQVTPHPEQPLALHQVVQPLVWSSTLGTATGSGAVQIP